MTHRNLGDTALLTGGTAYLTPARVTHERNEGVCPACEFANSAAAKFCGGCGKPLWEPCAKCGQANPMGGAYCGHCGVHVQETRATQREAAEAQWREAHSLHDAARYLDAISLLSMLARSSHPVASDLAREAQLLLPAWKQEMEQAQVRALTAGKEAQRQFEAQDFEGALQTLIAVPESLQSDAMRELAAELQLKHEEAALLAERIPQCITAKQYGDALAAIDRLLTLRPRDAELPRLAAKLAAHYAQSARKRLLAGQYDEALVVLSKVPVALRTPEVEQLHDEATEFVFLSASIRSAPVIEGSLEALAERLLSLAPDNVPVARLLAQMRLRRQQAGENPAPTALNWTSPPQRTAVGVPVDRWSGLRHLDCRVLLASPLAARQVDQFAVACGLALQGLGLAAVDTNLLPQPANQGMLGSLSSLGKLSLTSRKPPALTAWGIELSASGLKAVKLTRRADGSPVTVEQCDLVEHGKMLSLPGIESERPVLLAATLKSFLARNDLKGARVGLNLPGAKVLARFVSLPPVPHDRIEETMRLETPHQVALPIDELEWDYAVQGGEADADSSSRDVLLLAAKRLFVADRLKPFKEAGISIDVLQHEAVALHNLLAYERGEAEGAGAAAAESALAVLDIGCEATNLVVSSPRFTWFRTLPLGGNDITRALVRAFNLTFSQAEQVKREPTRAKRVSRVYSAVYPVFDELLSEVQRSLSNFTNQYRDLPLERLELLGGGSLQPGLWSYLRHGPLMKLPPLKKLDK